MSDSTSGKDTFSGTLCHQDRGEIRTGIRARRVDAGWRPRESENLPRSPGGTPGHCEGCQAQRLFGGHHELMQEGKFECYACKIIIYSEKVHHDHFSSKVHRKENVLRHRGRSLLPLVCQSRCVCGPRHPRVARAMRGSPPRVPSLTPAC